MHPFVERVTADIREVLGMTGRFSHRDDLDALLEWTNIRTELVPELKLPRYMAVGEHGGVIQHPRLTPRRWPGVIVHETGHGIFKHGLAALLYARARLEPALWRAARMEQWREEAIAEAFEHAWFLPAEVVRATPWAELSEASGCGWNLIRRRWRDLEDWESRQRWQQSFDRLFHEQCLLEDALRNGR